MDRVRDTEWEPSRWLVLLYFFGCGALLLAVMFLASAALSSSDPRLRWSGPIVAAIFAVRLLLLGKARHDAYVARHGDRVPPSAGTRRRRTGGGRAGPLPAPS